MKNKRYYDLGDEFNYKCAELLRELIVKYPGLIDDDIQLEPGEDAEIVHELSLILCNDEDFYKAYNILEWGK